MGCEHRKSGAKRRGTAPIELPRVMMRHFEILRAGIDPLRKERPDTAAREHADRALHRKAVGGHGEGEALAGADKGVIAAPQIAGLEKWRGGVNAAGEFGV